MGFRDFIPIDGMVIRAGKGTVLLVVTIDGVSVPMVLSASDAERYGSLLHDKGEAAREREEDSNAGRA